MGLQFVLLARGRVRRRWHGCALHADPALAMTPKARFAAAKPEVTKYLQALAMDKPLVAQQLAGSDAPG